MPSRSVAALITLLSRKYGLDPAAVRAVASVEGGLSTGAVGDSDSSYGPFQLHVGGALPRGRDAGWANSPAGIEYAISQMAQHARGLRGRAAIAAIVSNFERPANIPAEIAKASGRYGIGGGPAAAPGTGSMGGGGAPAAQPSPDLRRELATSLISSIGERSPDFTTLLSLAEAAKAQAAAATNVAPSAPRPNVSAPKLGGPSLSFLTPLAARFGLQITSTTGGVHARGSYHYQRRAEDYAGNTAGEAALARYALAHPRDFTEMFYTGPGAPGYFVKNGRVYPNSQLDPGIAAEHRNHVHLAR